MPTTLITGADGFIGSHLTEYLANNTEDKIRAFVYYNSFNSWGWLDTIPKETRDRIEIFAGDIRDPNGVREAMKGVDTVYHLAALIAIPFSYHSPDSYVDTNIKGMYLTCREALPDMISEKDGAIVNISSIWGVVGASCEAVYSAAKGGVVTFTKAMAKELGYSGIRVNCVSPGVIKTPMLDCYTAEDLQALADETPLGRIGLPEDVAKAVRFLIGDDAAFITGQNIVVDGGISL